MAKRNGQYFDIVERVDKASTGIVASIENAVGDSALAGKIRNLFNIPRGSLGAFFKADWGNNLENFVFKQSTDDAAMQLKHALLNDIEKYLPEVSIDAAETFVRADFVNERPVYRINLAYFNTNADGDRIGPSSSLGLNVVL